MKQVNEEKKIAFKNMQKRHDEEHSSLPNVLKEKSRLNKDTIVLHNLN